MSPSDCTSHIQWQLGWVEIEPQQAYSSTQTKHNYYSWALSVVTRSKFNRFGNIEFGGVKCFVVVLFQLTRVAWEDIAVEKATLVAPLHFGRRYASFTFLGKHTENSGATDVTFAIAGLPIVRGWQTKWLTPLISSPDKHTVFALLLFNLLIMYWDV